jgi:hypothetical protein
MNIYLVKLTEAMPINEFMYYCKMWRIIFRFISLNP